jgi:predicted dehydrogenase
MLVACKRNGVKLAIGHQRRFLPSYTEARSLIASGAIGDVQLMRSTSGAGLLNWGTHLFDMFRYILGDAECRFAMGAVERQTDRHERTTRIEDVAMGAFEFDGGVDALILSDFALEYYQGCMVYGSEGTIDLQTSYYGLLSKDTGGIMERRAPNGRFFDADHDTFEWHEGPAAQADELAEWIEGELDDYRGDAVNGYKSLEMAMAIYESARLHERVALPLRTRTAPLDLMVESGHLPVRYPGKYDIRNIQLRGTNMTSDEDNT